MTIDDTGESIPDTSPAHQPESPPSQPDTAGEGFSLADELLSERPAVSPTADRIASSLLSGNVQTSPEKKKTGRPPGRVDAKPRKARGSAAGSSVLGGVDVGPDQYAKAAAAMVGTFTGSMQALFDADEWRPTAGEMENLTMSAAAVCRKYGIDDFPPTLGLVIAVMGYALPRLAAPITRKKASGFVARFKAWREGREVRKPETKEGDK